MLPKGKISLSKGKPIVFPPKPIFSDLVPAAATFYVTEFQSLQKIYNKDFPELCSSGYVTFL